MGVLKLSAKELVKIYNKRKVVNGVNVELSPGEVVGLLGPNGAGKTTTFHMIVGLIEPDGGKIFLDGKNITGMAMHQRARLGINYLPQEPSIFRKLTVEENILAVLEIKKVKGEARTKKLNELLNLLKIDHIRKNYGYTLSGGERRRVEIARALATDPVFILLDEPFTGIDPIVRAEIQDIITNLKKRGIGVLVTDHNVRETLEITDRAYLIYDGRILFHGSRDELINNEEARKLYLGEKFKL